MSFIKTKYKVMSFIKTKYKVMSFIKTKYKVMSFHEAGTPAVGCPEIFCIIFNLDKPT